MHIITDERCLDYRATGHPERPERVDATLALLRLQDKPRFRWASPREPSRVALERGHTPSHLERLSDPAGPFDGDTPAYPGIADHALRAAGGAFAALELALEGERAMSLMRPPGHHATRDRAMGFCYLGSVGLSALHAARELGRRVAVFDFDVHHGNGTEDLLLGAPETAFFSVHQHPCYPGTGLRHRGDNCFNFPVAPRLPRPEYLRSLEEALEAMIAWKPDLIAVSAGFDAYRGDPLAEGTLEEEDFRWLGKRIAAAGLPFYSVLEGGYSRELPRLALAWIQGSLQTGP